MMVQEGVQPAAEDGQEEKEHGLVRALVGEGERERCRRVVLGGYLDRREVERVGCEEGEEKCDVCRGGEESSEEEDIDIAEVGGEADTIEAEAMEAEAMEAGEVAEREREERQRTFRQQEQMWRGPRQRFVEERQASYASMEWLGSQLAWWTDRCGICEAAGQGDSAHDVRRCWRPAGQQAQEMIEKMEKAIQFAPYSGCYWCGVLQAMCGRWEEDGQGRYRRVAGAAC